MLLTRRLRLREWLDEDVEWFAEHNGDPRVMKYFDSPLSVRETKESIARYRTCFAENGFCFFVAETRNTRECIGVIGLGICTTELEFAPRVEVGWRLTPSAWGQGYASEGGLASLAFAFSLGCEEVVAITSPDNLASRAVMRRIGMHYRSSDDYEELSDSGAFVQSHVVYRSTVDRFRDAFDDETLFRLE